MQSAQDCQFRYWTQFVQLRAHISYLHHYAAECDLYDRNINILLAITSNGSIAAWALWKEFIFLWPTLIALSQLVSAVKPMFPFKQSQKTAMELCNALQAISLSVEREWYSVSNGSYTDEKIHKLTCDFRDQLASAEQKHIQGAILPRKDRLLKKADTDAKLYFDQHYPEEASHGE